MDDDTVVIFRTRRQLVTVTSWNGDKGDLLSPCSIVNEGVVANTCCSFEVFTKLIMYPSLSSSVHGHDEGTSPTDPAIIRGRRTLTNKAVAFAIHQLVPQGIHMSWTHWNQL
jgi:hypothetical protein